MLNFKVTLVQNKDKIITYFLAKNAIELIDIFNKLQGVEYSYELDINGSDFKSLEKIYLFYVNSGLSLNEVSERNHLSKDDGLNIYNYFNTRNNGI